MHKYLHNYEDFLLIDDDYVARAGSHVVRGPKRTPQGGFPGDGEDDDFDSYDDYDDFDRDEDDEYRDLEEGFDRLDR